MHRYLSQELLLVSIINFKQPRIAEHILEHLLVP